MDSGRPFSIAVRTCNKQQGTGGEYIMVEQAVKSSFKGSNGEVPPSGSGGGGFRKNPQHYPNSTRNIVVFPEGNIMKIHLRLIMKFNDVTVL